MSSLNHLNNLDVNNLKSKLQSKQKSTFVESVFIFLLILIVAIPLSLFLVAYGAFAYGFVIMKLWAWIIVPIFHTDALPYTCSVALWIFLQAVKSDTYHESFNKDKVTTEAHLSDLFSFIFRPWLTLLLGFLVTKIM